MSKRRIIPMLAIWVAISLAACSSGGDGGGSGNTTPVAATLTGTFVDSPVNGIGYRSPSNPAGGVTKNGGEFECRAGELVTFYLGNPVRVIGSPQPCLGAPPVISVVSVLGKTSVADPEVINLSRLLLTLGGNSTPGSDPITINPALLDNLPPTLNFAVQNFDALLPSLTLASVQDATNHLAGTFKTLSVSVSTGGTVTSSPPGINCKAGSSTGCSFSFIANEAVTLTAAGSGFAGWFGGGCSGTGACIVTMNAVTSISATFGGASASGIYQFTWELAGQLVAIDPRKPSEPPVVAVSSGVLATEAFVSGPYNAGTKTFIGLHASSLVFVKDRSLFKIGMELSDGVPGSSSNNAVRLSAEASITDICGFNAIQNPVGIPLIAYELNGADGNCFTRGDNVTKLVPLDQVGSSSGPPAFILPPGVRIISEDPQVFDFDSGLSTYAFLVDEANNNTLKRLNLSTGTITTIQPGVASADLVEIMAQDTSDRVFLVGDRTVYLYTISTNVLTTLLPAGSRLRCPGRLCADSSDLYLVEDTGKVYRIPLAATGPADVTPVMPSLLDGSIAIQQLELTTNRIIVVTGSSGGVLPNNGMLSIPKGSNGQIALVPAAIGNQIFSLFTRDNVVFYVLVTPSGTAVDSSAFVMKEDGAAIVSQVTAQPEPGTLEGVQTIAKPLGPFPQGAWISRSTTSSFDPRRRAVEIERIVLMNGVHSPAVPPTPVYAFDASAPGGAVAVLVGHLPHTLFTPFTFVTSDVLDSAQLLLGETNGFFRSVFFLDTNVANSLVEVPMPAAIGGWQGVGF